MQFDNGHITCTLDELLTELVRLQQSALHPSDLHVSIMELKDPVDAFLFGLDLGQRIVSVICMGSTHIYLVTDTDNSAELYFRTVATFDYRSLCLSGTFWEDPSNREEIWDCLQVWAGDSDAIGYN